MQVGHHLIRPHTPTDNAEILHMQAGAALEMGVVDTPWGRPTGMRHHCD